MKDIVIAAGARTPMAEYNGDFSDISAIDLAVVASKAALERSGFTPDEMDHVIVGNALQTSGDAIYGARHVGLKAGIPNEVPALTVNRLCGSGIEAIVQAARFVKLGEADFALAGGMENMSQAPHVVRGGRTGFKFGRKIELEDLLFAALKDTRCNLFMAETADNLAKKYGITREAQDDFAATSMRRGLDATEAGIFREEIVAVDV